MPITAKDFGLVLRMLPKDASPEVIDKAVEAHQSGTSLGEIWKTVNKPLVGSADALIPQLRHTHAENEGGIRRTVEDLGASLTSPVNLGAVALSAGGSLAGKAGKFGISEGARLAEGALQAPFVAEGLHKVVDGNSTGEKLGGAAEAALGIHGISRAAERPHLEVSATPILETPASALHLPEQPPLEPVMPRGDGLALADAAIDHMPPTAGGQSPGPSSLQLSQEVLNDVNQRHATSGGSTTDLKTGKPLTLQDARYMVSPYEDRQQLLDHAPTEQELRNYVAKNEDLLAKPGHNLGTWDNAGKHYLDVSIGENDPQKALELGRQHNQLAIFDMLGQKEIPVEAPIIGLTAKDAAGKASLLFKQGLDVDSVAKRLAHMGLSPRDLPKVLAAAQKLARAK